MSSIEIRPLAAADVEETVALWARSRWDAQPWLEERLGYGPDDDLRFFTESIMPEYDVQLAYRDETLIGMMAISGRTIGQLYIDPPHQGQGAGTRLLELAQSMSPDGLELYTHQRNERARAFYEARGFRPIRFGTSPAPESEPDVFYRWRPATR